MPRRNKYTWGDYLIWLAIALWILWVIKQILGLDPALIENFLSAIPWAAAIFGAGGSTKYLSTF